MTIVIVGGSGYIGTLLSKKLLSSGHRVIVVDVISPRFTHAELFFIQCDTSTQKLPYDVLEHTDAVINLAGKTIATKWNEEVKKTIRESRIETTKNIVAAIGHTKSRPSCFICASAVGFYGDTATTVCTETCPRGEGFLAEVVADWEQEAQKASEYGVRTVYVRTGIVLGKGGFLSSLTKTARFGFLTKLSKKDSVLSWIHEEDIVATYLFALETQTLHGVFNACAPEVVTQNIFTQTLAKVLKKKIIVTLPVFVAKKMFGEFLAEITKSQHVVPAKIMDKGFSFSYPTLKEALQAIYTKHG